MNMTYSCHVRCGNIKQKGGYIWLSQDVVFIAASVKNCLANSFILTHSLIRSMVIILLAQVLSNAEDGLKEGVIASI